MSIDNTVTDLANSTNSTRPTTAAADSLAASVWKNPPTATHTTLVAVMPSAVENTTQSTSTPVSAPTESILANQSARDKVDSVNGGHVADTDTPNQNSQTHQIDQTSSISQTDAPTQAVYSPRPQPTKKSWLVLPIVALLGLGGYGISKLGGDTSPSNTATTNSDNVATASAQPDTASYEDIIEQLPQAKTDIAHADKQSSLLSSSAGVYQDTLGFSANFMKAVNATAEQGETDLNRLVKTANTHDIAATKSASIDAFRDADMSYFNDLKTNAKLAAQLNNTAKTYYWDKKDPQAALYLQAQAVKNHPTHSEYVANLAFYLTKNDYPDAKDFVLYALQTPRDPSKPANTYMIELAAALAVKQQDTKAAVGALLTQYYTSDDKEKRCQNMLRYPRTYPELVPIAEKVLITIDEQNNEGVMPSPDACKPPFNWAK